MFLVKYWRETYITEWSDKYYSVHLKTALKKKLIISSWMCICLYNLWISEERWNDSKESVQLHFFQQVEWEWSAISFILLLMFLLKTVPRKYSCVLLEWKYRNFVTCVSSGELQVMGENLTTWWLLAEPSKM